MNFDKLDVVPVKPFVFDAHRYQYLLPLKPYGLEGGEIEAMSSYLLRHADKSSEPAYSFLYQLLSQHLQDPEKPTRKPNDAGGVYACNGFGKWAQRISTAFTNGSQGKFNPTKLTLIPLQLLSDRNSRGLLKTHLSWCNECYRNDLAEQRTPYVRLYWLMQIVDSCAIHNTKLKQHCFKCAEVQPVIKRIPRQWICDRCAFDQTDAVDNPDGPVSLEKEWISLSIYRLIERVNARGFAIGEINVQKAFSQIMKYHNLTPQTFAEKINMSVDPVREISLHNARPYFPFLADVCYRINVPIDQFIFDSDILSSPALWSGFSKPRYVATTHISDKVKAALQIKLKNLVRENPTPPISVSHVALQLKIDYNVVRYHFPEEFAELRRRYLKWDALRLSDNKHIRLKKLMAGVEDLANLGMFPSDKKLRELGYLIVSDLRREDIRMMLKAFQEYYQFLDRKI